MAVKVESVGNSGLLLKNATLIYEEKKEKDGSNAVISGSYNIGDFSTYSKKYKAFVIMVSRNNPYSSAEQEKYTAAGFVYVPIEQIALAIEHYEYVAKISSSDNYQNKYYIFGRMDYQNGYGNTNTFGVVEISLPNGSIANISAFANGGYNFGIFRLYGV